MRRISREMLLLRKSLGSTVSGSPFSEIKGRSDAAAQASQAPPDQSLPTAEASHLRWPVPLRGLGVAERLRTKLCWSL
ncbi:hypothetical protein Y697_11735 [Mesotoga sp. BH458_6_3_2_1]|nr:hypothetical protein Y697_11735 [Mesotoga sp. BH458_6_3_2_1]